MMSFYELPVGVRKRIDFYRARMLWQEEEVIRKISFSGLEEGGKLKEQGGLGILDLEIMNPVGEMDLEAFQYYWLVCF